MNVLTEKLREVALSVLPITAIVVLLHFTIAPVGGLLLGRFLIGTALVTIGLTVFLVGVDVGITPIGNIMGAGITKTNKLWMLIVSGLVLGFFVTVAEPDLHILADQVEAVTGGLIAKAGLVAVVSAGIGVMITLGLLRIVFSVPLYRMFTVIYAVILVLSLFSSQEFLAISFDASGATTGGMSVPFILALAVGISSMEKNSRGSEKDSFGLLAVASTGAILSTLAMSLFGGRQSIPGAIDASTQSAAGLLSPFLSGISGIALEILIALVPIFLLFAVFQAALLRSPRRVVRKILTGVLMTYVGLVIFMDGVNGGFMEVGRALGRALASFDSKLPLIGVGFLLGVVTILAEPAVHVLTAQIEDVTSGAVRRRLVLAALALGVGVAVALSMVRILIPEIKLWHYLLPGYAITLALMYVVPKMFIGMAFDSGGVAAGTMTGTVILAFAQGAADRIESASVMVDSFGMIAMVALTPILAIEILGGIYKLSTRREGAK